MNNIRPMVSYKDIKENPQCEIISESYKFDKKLGEYVLESFEVKYKPLNKEK